MSALDRGAAFAALADDTRWHLLQRVAAEPASASRLARELPMTRQAVAHHLDVLRESGLVETERVGREVVYRALGARLSELGDMLRGVAHGWDARLESLQREAEPQRHDEP